ncbi:hypothetical protein CVT25_015381 [Psilocybe cyanescens]|uniref:Fe2OG dioxygenase domain-containing protein n=1 Tax=Psilocybe cyanescens TaxID=93625 RepID=A0A409WH88_PSICY|nr:hypothetical protein CVT25_015381 [Psilocybe cyanescens]
MPTYPPFPTDDSIPVQDLLVVDYKLLKDGDKAQADILWEAATKWGFWYLKNHAAELYVEPMFQMGRETLALPFEEKMKYWQGNKGASAGYKVAGATYVDVDGNTDVSEFINVSKDDAMAYPRVVHRVYPAPVNIYMKDTIRPFIQTCLEESLILLDVFNDRLGLPKDTLLNLHDRTKHCISEARCIKVPAAPKDTKIALGPHTDVGSVSFLANQLGGLQVLIPDSDGGKWKYVKPIQGYFICNIGDSLNILSGGILKSCTHRVLPPPGAQAGYERWSLVYFSRPTNDVNLEALANQSALVAEAVQNADKAIYFSGMTAAQCIPVQDLLVVDYKLLKEGDKDQADILWEAATKWGFWYLKNHEAERYVEPMFKMGRETLALPFDEKMRYWQGNKGASAGFLCWFYEEADGVLSRYKAAGSAYVDVDGSTDASEFINVAKDDAMAYPRVVHKAYPATVNTYMVNVIRPFIHTCLEESRVLMDVFNHKLGLPKDTLINLHDHTKYCISETRCIKVPAAPKGTKMALGQHTDYGSLSFLANRLGGLQVLIPDNDGSKWKYVKPIEGYFICNIGDTLTILSGGILKSCTHRVVPPPGAQAGHERWSLVYFVRPTNDVYLEALVNQSALVAEASQNVDKATYFPGLTAAQWFVKKQTQYRTDKDKVRF